MVQTGAKAQRVYVLSVQQEFDKACGRETHILAPETADGMPRLNEKAMRVYDNMIAEADKQGLRLILPFIDHWWWWGGREQLAAFYHEKAEDFYRTDSKTFKAYLDVIRQVIIRTNTVTGRAYYDEKAIMAWKPVTNWRIPTPISCIRPRRGLKSGPLISWLWMAPIRKLIRLR